MAIIDKEKLKDLLSEMEKLKRQPEYKAGDKDFLSAEKEIQGDIDALKSKAKESIKAQFNSQELAAADVLSGQGAVAQYMPAAAEKDVENEVEKQQKIAQLMATEEGRIALANAEAKGGLDAFIRGLQRGSQVIGKGVGLDIQQMDPTYIKAMEVAHPTAFGGGKLGYEVGALAPVAAGTAAISGPAIAAGGLPAAGGIALEALGGGLQANILARGENQSGTEVVGQTGLGAAIGGAVSGIPYIGKPVGAWLGKKFGLPTRKVVDDAGNLTPEFVGYAKKQGLNEQDIINEAQNGAENIRAMGPMLPKTPADANTTPQEWMDSLANLINPRADVMEDYAKIGINPENVPIAILAGNKNIQEMGAILNQVRGAGIGSERDKLLEAANQVNKSTQEIIEDFGGKISVADFSTGAIQGMQATRRTLKDAEEEAFDVITRQMDAVTLNETNTGIVNIRVAAPEVVKRLEREKALYPKTGLNEEEKRVYDLFTGKTKPSFSDVKKVRSDIGKIAFDPKEAFDTVKTAKAKELYEELRVAENRFAASILGDDSLEAVKRISADRFKVDGYLEFFGQTKDKPADIGKKLLSAASDIKGSNYQNLTQVFDNLPQEYRKGAMASMLGRIADPNVIAGGNFIPGLGARAGDFTKAWGNIKKSDHLNAFVKKQLGDEGYEAFDLVGRFYAGLSRASSVPATGQMQTALMTMLPEQATGKLLKSLSTNFKKVPSFFARGAGNAADIAAAVVSSGTKEEVTRVVDSLGHLTRSPKFTEAVLRAANDPTSAEARQKSAQFMNTKIAQQYLKTVDPKIAQAVIAAGGLPRYLVAQDNEEVKQ